NIVFNNIHNITIATNYSNAWFFFISSSLKAAGLNPVGFPTQYNLTNMGQFLKLDFQSTLTVNLNFKIVEILAQIGPGWIE
ncbi:MAG: hypothetical protein ACQXXF_06535, partial [Thermoplasmatota archaeon]